MVLDKKNWVCLNPYEYVEIFKKETALCCPQWLPEKLGDPTTVLANWKSPKADSIRESVSDGSYRHCNENTCPHLSNLKLGNSKGFIHKSQFNDYLERRGELLPIIARLSFDESCNLKCPSCRVDFINTTGKKLEKVHKTMNEVEIQLGPSLERIDCTGSGDPFYSKTFKKWMMNLDKAKYPNLKHIHLHTNGTLWNRSNWDKIKNVHTLVKSCEISIDAATKTTYEKYTRIGGKWESLIENLNFISTIPQLKTLQFSFVVQEANFKEMKEFYDLIYEIFNDTGKEWRVFYNRVSNWGTFTSEEYKQIDIADPTHPRSEEYLRAFKLIPSNVNVIHNLPIKN